MAVTVPEDFEPIAELRGWARRSFDGQPHLSGRIYSDRSGRSRDGTFRITAAVLDISDDDIAKTEDGRRYLLVDPA